MGSRGFNPGGYRPPGGGGNRPPRQDNEQPIVAVQIRYFSEKGIPDSRLLDEEAEKIGKSLADNNLAPTQLRRFFEDVHVLKRRMEHETANTGESSGVVFARLLPEFKMMRAKAYYARKRLKGNFPQELLQFFVNHTASVKSAEDFSVFCKHFEAVVAFHKYYAKDR